MSHEKHEARAGKTGKEDGKLEKLAQAIDPPSREISAEELADPGANIPRTPMGTKDETRMPRTRR